MSDLVGSNEKNTTHFSLHIHALSAHGQVAGKTEK